MSDEPQQSRSLIDQADLFGTTQQNVSLHLQNIYDECGQQPAATHKEFLSVRREVELRQPPTVQNHLTVRQEGARQDIRTSERRFYQKITDVDATRIWQIPIPRRAEKRERRDC